jgi:thioredoxin-like negative regulator of GroEL
MGPRERPNVEGETSEEGESDPQVAEATRLYDKGDYPGALDAALKVLETDPSNIKMLRVVVSTKCALNEVDSARSYFEKLPRHDQRQMRTRCKNWGVEL